MTKIVSCLIIFITLISAAAYVYARPIWIPIYTKIIGKKSVNDVIAKYETETEKRLSTYFTQAGLQYPPQNIKLLAMKQEKKLELWASSHGDFVFIRDYPILAASGLLGPKLMEGDKQVPEGIYTLEYLNPNSAYHLSMKLNYPNAFDLKHARIENRQQPGTNIFIHGKALSIGCLAMGDTAIEELFVLTATIGKDAVEVAIAPVDPRQHDLMLLNDDQPSWVTTLYSDLDAYFSDFRHSQ